MKKQFPNQKMLLLVLVMITAFGGHAQQQITQTVTAQNRNCNATCSVIDIPELNNNPVAVMFITPVLVNGANLNPHPIGANYMYLNKWSIFNLDGTAIALGAKFNVEYYINPDATHFVYVLPSRTHFNDISYIEYAGLNNNPNAQIRVFPHISPTMGYLWNRYDVKVTYDATVSKWAIANLNGTPIASDAAYNIMFTNGTGNTTTVSSPGGICNCVIPTSLPPNGVAGGDLSGTFPYPIVKGIQGKPVSNDPPAVGQVLKWNGSAWEPANENGGGGAAYNAGTGLAIQGTTIYANNIAPMWNANKLSGNAVSNTSPVVGQVLKWNGVAWEPAADNAGTATQTAPAAKPSVLFYTQNNDVELNYPSTSYAPIPGINNQFFTLTQSSRIVFHIAIEAQNANSDLLTGDGNATVTVEILNATNQMVARLDSRCHLVKLNVQNINGMGIGVLPAGTYHTNAFLRSTYNGGGKITFYKGGADYKGVADGGPSQGGQLVIEIFPD